MPNKPGHYEDPSWEKGKEIKARLTALRARYMSKSLPEIDLIDGVSGRLWDISKPLLQICKLIGPDFYDQLVEALIVIASERQSEKQETIEGKICSIINELSPTDNGIDFFWEISTADVLEKFNNDVPENYKRTSQWLGKKLKALGIKTSRATGRSQIQMNREPLNTLRKQYGLGIEPIK